MREDIKQSLSEKLEKTGEIVFEIGNKVILIWETEQGEENSRGDDYMNYMYKSVFELDYSVNEDDAVEIDGGLCTGTPRDAILMATGE